MPNDISLPAITAVRVGSSGSTEPRAAAPNPAPAVAVTPPAANPTLRLDAELGLVVIEFRDASGAITTSIPSQRQLQEYQRWETTQVGPAPAGSPDPGIAARSLVPAAGRPPTSATEPEASPDSQTAATERAPGDHSLRGSSGR